MVQRAWSSGQIFERDREGAWHSIDSSASTELSLLPGEVVSKKNDASVFYVKGALHFVFGGIGHLKVGARTHPVFDLEYGNLIVSSPRETRVHLPRYEMVVKGTNFGVWIVGKELWISTISGGVSVLKNDGVSVELQGSRTLWVTGDEESVLLASDRLQLRVDRVVARGRAYEVKGQASPGSLLWSRGVRKVKRVQVDSVSGIFRARVERDPREEDILWARDALGRVARMGRPSAPLKAHLKRLRQLSAPPMIWSMKTVQSSKNVRSYGGEGRLPVPVSANEKKLRKNTQKPADSQRVFTNSRLETESALDDALRELENSTGLPSLIPGPDEVDTSTQ